MRRYKQICFAMMALGLALAAQAQEAGKAKPKVAVLPFQNKADNQWLKDERRFKKTVTPCVEQLIAKWCASKLWDWWPSY